MTSDLPRKIRRLSGIIIERRVERDLLDQHRKQLIQILDLPLHSNLDSVYEHIQALVDSCKELIESVES